MNINHFDKSLLEELLHRSVAAKSKIVSLDEALKIDYSNVEIQVSNMDNLDRLYEVIKDKGSSKIKISFENKNKTYLFELKEKRKFDNETLKNLPAGIYIG